MGEWVSYFLTTVSKTEKGGGESLNIPVPSV
jgi:hypothetical protein